MICNLEMMFRLHQEALKYGLFMSPFLIFKCSIIFEYFLIFYTVQHLDIPSLYLNIQVIFKYGLVMTPYFNPGLSPLNFALPQIFKYLPNI